ncbi:MAG TPA: PAS domain S-box protein [Pyrinomonadaceae bacterium]|nr:PAS domain S-box protein [Pyrinomonadaceae bacterium]
MENLTTLPQLPRVEERSWKTHWLFRYGLAIALYAVTLGLSMLLSYANARINLTIPVVLALVAGAWYGGRMPGLLIAVLFQTTTILYAPVPADSTVPKAIFQHFSVFSLYVFLVLVISGLKTVQQRLSEQRDLLQVTLSSIGDAVIATDTKGSVTFMNPVAQELTGWEEASARGTALEDVFHIVNEQTDDTVENPVAKVLSTGAVVGLANHTILVSKDGSNIPIDASAAPIVDRGEIKGVVLVFSDVSERKHAEAMASRRSGEIAALYDFSQRLQHADSMDEVYEAALDSIFVSLDCDRAAVLLFDDTDVMSFVAARGLSTKYREAVSGHSPWKAEDNDAQPFSVEDLDAADLTDELRETIRNEGIVSLAFIPLVAGDRLMGKLMVYFDEPHSFTDSEFEMAMTIGNQIAAGVERKRTERKLLENEERLRLATQTGNVGVWDWDVRADHIEWTDSVYSIHGIPLGRFDGRSETFAERIHPEDREFVSKRIEMALSGEMPYDLEFRIARPDGDVRWLYTNALVLRDDSGPYRMIGATVDITDRLRAEAARRESEIMHRLVEAQEAERHRIARDLHDHLGQKMTALRLQTEALSAKCADDPSLAAAVLRVQKSAVDVDRDIGFLSWELRPTELENLGLENALTTFVREWSGQYGIKAEFHTSKTETNGNGSRLDHVVETNLYRIVQEALNNVLKHADAKSVSVLLHHRKDEVVLIVEDNGCGFDEAMGAANGATRGGLGLVGMKERSALLNGVLEIDSQPGTGTTVVARIPLN